MEVYKTILISTIVDRIEFPIAHTAFKTFYFYTKSLLQDKDTPLFVFRSRTVCYNYRSHITALKLLDFLYPSQDNIPILSHAHSLARAHAHSVIFGRFFCHAVTFLSYHTDFQ